MLHRQLVHSFLPWGSSSLMSVLILVGKYGSCKCLFVHFGSGYKMKRNEVFATDAICNVLFV